VLELGDRLGPVLWQFAPTKKFDEADFAGFLELLPRKLDGRDLRHVVEVRHDSFRVAAFIDLLRRFKIPVVFSEHATYPAIADITGDFVYARLQKGRDDLATGYPPSALDAWAGGLRPGRPWRARDLPRAPQRHPSGARDVSPIHPRRQGAGRRRRALINASADSEVRKRMSASITEFPRSPIVPVWR